MNSQKNNIINFNHIDESLTESQIDELKSCYRTYHKKCGLLKKLIKSLKKEN